MRIAYLTPTFPPYPGGIGINAFYSAQEMAQRGFSVEVFTPRYSKQTAYGKRLTANGLRQTAIDNRLSAVSIHYLRPIIKYGKAGFLPQLFWRLRHFDVVHAYYPFFGGLEIAALARCFFKFKLVLHHEMDIVGEGWMKKFFSWHTRHILPWLLRKTDLLLVLSEDYFQNSDIGKLYVKKINLPPWQVMPNGVDTELFYPCEVRTKYEYANNSISYVRPSSLVHSYVPIILFAAGLDKAHYFKGVPVLLQAAAILKKQNILFKLEIAGEGELKSDYQKLAKELGLEKETRFVGLVTHENLPDFYRQGTIFVMPSVGHTESFSIATAEAQACGLPAVVSDLPGMRVTLENNVTGFATKPGDPQDLAEKIRTILQNPEQGRQMGQAGRERVERMFSWKKIGEKLEGIYYKLAREK